MKISQLICTTSILFGNFFYHLNEHRASTLKEHEDGTMNSLLDDKFVEAWVLLGDVNIGLGDKKNGIDAYRKSISLAPRFSFPMYYRLAIAEHSLGYYSEALQHIQKYLSSKKIS